MNKEQQEALRAPFPAKAIQKLPVGGTKLDYVSHAWVTDRLLEIDPEWTWEPVGFDEYGLPKLDSTGGLWIKLTVCGVTRYGYGEPQGRDQHDKVKGAIGNAIRVAAMRFGVALDLWIKEEPVAETKETKDGFKPNPVYAKMVQRIAEAASIKELMECKEVIKAESWTDAELKQLREFFDGKQKVLV